MHSLALSGSSLPPRLAYTQAAQLQVAAQQLAAQQAAAQAAAPPTTRYYTGSLHGREVWTPEKMDLCHEEYLTNI